MELFVILYRGKDHSLDHDERSHIVGIYDSEVRAQEVAETAAKNGRFDFRRISIVPFDLNHTYV